MYKNYVKKRGCRKTICWLFAKNIYDLNKFIELSIYGIYTRFIRHETGHKGGEGWLGVRGGRLSHPIYLAR